MRNKMMYCLFLLMHLGIAFSAWAEGNGFGLIKEKEGYVEKIKALLLAEESIRILNEEYLCENCLPMCNTKNAMSQKPEVLEACKTIKREAFKKIREIREISEVQCNHFTQKIHLEDTIGEQVIKLYSSYKKADYTLKKLSCGANEKGNTVILEQSWFDFFSNKKIHVVLTNKKGETMRILLEQVENIPLSFAEEPYVWLVKHITMAGKAYDFSSKKKSLQVNLEKMIEDFSRINTEA